MPKARKRLVSLQDTPYYHCISRCVRRAYLCGQDDHSGYSFEHRRQWIVDRINLLSSIFSIDVCAYAIMSNHYHVVIHVDAEKAQSWSNHEVAERWLRMFSGPEYVRHWFAGETVSDGERAMAEQILQTWRQRLHDLSWFMRCLNEPIARMANAEDKCTGRFWEGRFKSQALLDERALLSCMAYVDLNPIRAGMAPTPEESDYTSIQHRIRHTEEHALMPFVREAQAAGEIISEGLPYELRDYLELVDWAGRQIRPGKRGIIDAQVPHILQRLEMDNTTVMEYLSTKHDLPLRALGSVDRLRAMAESVGLKFLHGVGLGKCLYALRA
jgi:putative transposase